MRPPVLSRYLCCPRWLIAVVVLLNLAVAGVAAVTVDLDLKSRRETADAAVRLLSGILVDQIDHCLHRVSLELHTIADEVARGGGVSAMTDPAGLGRFLDRHRQRMAGVEGLAVFDAAGRLVLASAGAGTSPAGPIAAMAFFSRLRDDPAAGLVVSRPIADADGHRRLLLIARRIDRPGGGFDGLAVAILSAAQLSEMFAQANPDPGMNVSLVNREMEFIARHPVVAATEGAAISTAVSDRIRSLIEAGAEAVPARYLSRLDGQARTAFMRKVPGQPLYFTVGIADETFLKPWRAEGARVGLLALSFSLVSLLLTLAVRRNWLDREAAIVALEAAHAEVRSHAERLDMVLRGANDGWWDWDLLHDEMYVSPRWWEMLGHDPQGRSGSPDLWRRRTHPDDLGHVESDLRRFIASGETTVRMEIRLRHADGHYLPILIRGYILRDLSGRALRMSGTITDLTNIRRVEATLQAMFDLSPLGKCRTASDGRILDVNAALCDIVGLERDVLIGAIRPGLVPLPGPGEEGHLRERLEQTGSYGPVETLLIRTDGRPVPVRLRGVWIRDESGPDSIYAIVEDITEERTVMQALEERTRDLARSNADLEQFAYVASHDLREPLRMVSGFLGLLERRYAGSLDAEATQFIAFAKEGAQRMDRLILDLLDFSRIGRAGAEIETVELGSAAEQAISNLALGVEESGARIEIDPDLGAARVSGDRAQLISLFQNLIGNALKYRGPDRAPLIRIAGRRSGGDWDISVADNGIGIEPVYFDRIFRIFQRLHTRDQYEGTGIGLAVCRKIVEHHGGRIWVESVPGDGSTFRFTLPAAP